MKQLYTLFIFVFIFIQNPIVFGQTFEPLPGPTGVFVNEICINTSGHIFISVPYEGVFRSVNNGQTWDLFMNGIPLDNNYAHSLTAAPNGEVYLINNNIFYRLPAGGTQWVSKAVMGLSRSSEISVNPDGNIFVCLNKLEIMKAESGTAAFNSLGELPGFNYFEKMVSFGNDQNYGLYNYLRELRRFSDNGFIHEDVTPSQLGNYEYLKDMHRLSDGTLLLASRDRIFISDNNAQTWTTADVDPNIDGEDIFAAHLTADEKYFILTHGNVYLSEDGGNSFEKLSGFPFEHYYFTGSAMTSFENHFYMASRDDFFVHSANEGQTWERLDPQFTFPTTYEIYESPFKDLFIQTGKVDGVEKSDNWGQTWETINLNGLTLNSIVVHPNGDWFAASRPPDWRLFRSQDSGQSWTEITPTGLVYGQTHQIAVTPDGTILSADREYLLRSEDLGETWESQQSSGQWRFPPAYHPGGDIYLNTTGSVQRSSDDGKTWVSLVNGVGPLSTPVICENGDVLFSVEIPNPVGTPTFEHFYIINNGNTPTNIQLPFWGDWGTEFECDCDNNIFVTNAYDLYKSSDGGQNWTSVLLGNHDINRIEYLFFDSKNYLYVGRLYDTPLKSENPTCDFVDDVFESNKNEIQVNISPNPMSDFALIEIENEVEREYNFRLFDVLGKEFRTEKFNLNTHQFEKGNLNSGIYFYQIETENQVFDSGKLIIK